MVNAVVQEWHCILREEIYAEEGELDGMMDALFAIFYVDDAYLASRDPVFLQQALDVLVDTFTRVGLETNTKKTQAMACTPGKIRLQLPADSYRRMRSGYTSASKWEARTVTCRKCGKPMWASSLGPHLIDVHKIYQQAVVSEELLDHWEPVLYQASKNWARKYPCPYPRCKGELDSGWMMRWHFRDVHPKDLVAIPREGQFPRCERCVMQCNPSYPMHINTKECRAGTEWLHQRDMAVRSALALRQQFTVHGDMLERVDVF
jgi:hypothetical protein